MGRRRRAPRPGLAFPLGALFPGLKERKAYLFVCFTQGRGQETEDLRGEDAPAGGEEGAEAAPSREEAVAKRRRRRRSRRGVSTLLRAPSPSQPRRPWPPELPAAARPHDGLNHHLHPVHRRVPALRGAREVRTELVGCAPAWGGRFGAGQPALPERGGGGEGSVGRKDSVRQPRSRYFANGGRPTDTEDRRGVLAPAFPLPHARVLFVGQRIGLRARPSVRPHGCVRPRVGESLRAGGGEVPSGS